MFLIARYNYINGPAWYITFLFCYYFIFYIVYRTGIIKDSHKAWFLLLINCCFWYFIPAVFPAANSYAFSFFMGVFISWKKCLEAYVDGKDRKGYVTAVIAVTVFFLLIYKNGFFVGQFRLNNLIQNIAVAICTVGIVIIVKILDQRCTDHEIIKSDKKLDVGSIILDKMEKVGEISFYPYALHWALVLMPLRAGMSGWITIVTLPLTFFISFSIRNFQEKKILTYSKRDMKEQDGEWKNINT